MASDKRANLIITLKDEVSTGLGKLSGALKAIKDNFFAVTAAIGTVVAIAADFVKAAIESEDATNKLNIALKNQRIYSAELSKEMQEYASQLQKTSTFSDEAILRTQAMLTTFGIAGKSMRTATQASLDLASGLGIDLNSAALLVGKAFSGETATLSRYGLVIDQNVTKSQKFSETIKQIQQRFGGEAQAATQTFSGKVAVLNNQFDDVKENIGKQIIPVLQTYLEHVNIIVDAMNKWGGVMNTLKIVGLEFSKSIIDGILLAVENLPILGSAFQLMGINLDAVNTKIDEQIAKYANLSATGQQATKDLMDSTVIHERTLTDINNKEIDSRIKRFIKSKQDEVVAEKKANDDIIDSLKNKVKLTAELEQQRANNFASTMNFISSLSQSKNRELAAIGKAAAITGAYIDTYAAANKALASAPPPYNFILAALVTTAGLANVAKISGIQLAQGGMVLPRGGGVPATIAEAGHAEAVIPLDDERTREKLASSGFGGSGLTVNITAGVIIGGEDSMKALAREIDRELFELQRNKESVAFGGL